MEVASYLPTSSTASLALITRRVYTEFDLSTFRKLKARDIPDYTELLALLAKDQPRLSLCHFCVCLHEVADRIYTLGACIAHNRQTDESRSFIFRNLPF